MSLDARVGIVLVSHSAELAEGAAALAAQISGGAVAIIPAGGTDEGQLGTSAAKVQRAVKLADSGAGVVILPDLGSAVLTVRALLGEAGDLPAPVELADAPFVEGAVAATVAAAGGADIKAVLAAAAGRDQGSRGGRHPTPGTSACGPAARAVTRGPGPDRRGAAPGGPASARASACRRTPGAARRTARAGRRSCAA